MLVSCYVFISCCIFQLFTTCILLSIKAIWSCVWQLLLTNFLMMMMMVHLDNCRHQISSPVLRSDESIRAYSIFVSLGHAWKLSENMTASAKPEVHNLLHCCQRRTRPRRKVQNLHKICLNLNMREDRQTDNHADHDAMQAYAPLPTAI